MGRAVAQVVAGVATTAILSALLPLSATLPAAAAPGDLDATFGGGDGRVSFDAGSSLSPFAAAELEVLPDGRSMVLGRFGIAEDPQGIVLMRLLADGSVDPSWHGGTPVSPPVPTGTIGGYDTEMALDLKRNTGRR